MNYLLDTNIVLIYLRDSTKREVLDKIYAPFGSNNIAIISVVTVGEIKSIAKRNYWGTKKLQLLQDILSSLIITDINAEDVIEKYAEIDSYSQGKLKENPLTMTARNMGKNDLWIAATAAVTGATLLTADKDFEHLHGSYFQVLTIKV